MLRPGRYTAYDVLQFVRRVVKREPLRLYMGDWVTAFKMPPGLAHHWLKKVPTCGTVACVGGWIGIAVTGKEHFGGYSALELLGLDDDSTAGGELYSLFMQTDLNAERAIRVLDDYMARHKPALLDKVVVVPRRTAA